MDVDEEPAHGGKKIPSKEYSETSSNIFEMNLPSWQESHSGFQPSITLPALKMAPIQVFSQAGASSSNSLEMEPMSPPATERVTRGRHRYMRRQDKFQMGIRVRGRSRRVRFQRHRRVKRLERVQESIDALPPVEQRTKAEQKLGRQLHKKRERILTRISNQDEEMMNDSNEYDIERIRSLREGERYPTSLLAAASRPTGSTVGGAAIGSPQAPISWRRNLKKNKKLLASIPEDPVLAAGLASLQQSLGSLGISSADTQASSSVQEK